VVRPFALRAFCHSVCLSDEAVELRGLTGRTVLPLDRIEGDVDTLDEDEGRMVRLAQRWNRNPVGHIGTSGRAQIELEPSNPFARLSFSATRMLGQNGPNRMRSCKDL